MEVIAHEPDVHSMTVLPEGVMINYLLRMPNSVPYLTFLPTDLLMFDEQRMLEAFRTHPPDVIVLIPRDTGEYGAKFFGRDYAQAMWTWVQSNYRSLAKLEETIPGQEKKSGMWIMKRNDSGAAMTLPATLK